MAGWMDGWMDGKATKNGLVWNWYGIGKATRNGLVWNWYGIGKATKAPGKTTRVATTKVVGEATGLPSETTKVPAETPVEATESSSRLRCSGR